MRILVLAFLTAGWAISTPATVGYFAWQHQDSGVGWFTVGVLANNPDNPTTSNVQLDDVKLIVNTDLGGIFQYLLTPGTTRALTQPVQEPGVKWPGSLSQTLVAQDDPTVEYHSREFNPLAACSMNAVCLANAIDGTKSTDRIVQARLEYRAVLLDPAWNINLYPGTAQFKRDFDNSYVYSAVMGDGIHPFLYSGTPDESYVNVDLTVPGIVVPEPSAAVLMVAGLMFIGLGAIRSKR